MRQRNCNHPEQAILHVPNLLPIVPIARIAVFYKEDSSSDTYYSAELLHTFIDTQIIVESPDEYFWGGIGDNFKALRWSSSRDVDLVLQPSYGSRLQGEHVDPLLTMPSRHLPISVRVFHRMRLSASYSNIIVTARWFQHDH